jgi:pyrroloquinoline quinone (PQQ) biosynthesis protein C
VQARLRGEFTLDQIRAVELQHYYEAQHFSGFVLNVIKKCDADREARKWMIDNFVEEASGDEDHAELILILLDELGVARQQAYAIEPTPGVVAWREILEGLTTRRSFLEAMAPFMLEAVYPRSHARCITPTSTATSWRPRRSAPTSSATRATRSTGRAVPRSSSAIWRGLPSNSRCSSRR